MWVILVQHIHVDIRMSIERVLLILIRWVHTPGRRWSVIQIANVNMFIDKLYWQRWAVVKHTVYCPLTEWGICPICWWYDGRGYNCFKVDIIDKESFALRSWVISHHLFLFVVDETPYDIYSKMQLVCSVLCKSPERSNNIICVTYHSQRKALVANYGSANPPARKWRNKSRRTLQRYVGIHGYFEKTSQFQTAAYTSRFSRKGYL